jgi:nitrite reductase/ring-hydroxylating ferredoxin subunit/DMSO/TMAO reductase YedYZ heme-binding membrane subunit
MSAGFQAVQWNAAKYKYDAILIAVVAAYLIGFIGITAAIHPPKSAPEWIDLRIRAFGTCAFLMLTVILSIGPLARLNPKFLPLLYNRRHFGVLFFFVASVHAASMVQWFAVQDALPSLVDELTNWGNYFKFIGFPFKTLGIVALTIFFFMATTSHDYWLGFLKPPVWKALHMLVYAAYGLIVVHVALGIMQRDYSPLIPIMLGASLALVGTLHSLAGWRELKRDEGSTERDGDWLPVGTAQSIADKRATIVATPGGERIAVYRDGNQIGALSNLCAHQNGPIGEGCILDGLVTCPWHGYQYRLADGCAPPPFTEKLVTYRVRLRNGNIEVDPRPLPPGTPAAIDISTDQA